MDEALPLPGNVEAHLESRPEDFIGGQWLLVDINMKQFDGRTERINITMPRRLLVKIDSFVSEHPQFGNRSAFLAEAARRVLLGKINYRELRLLLEYPQNINIIHHRYGMARFVFLYRKDRCIL